MVPNDKIVRVMGATMYLSCPICGKAPKVKTSWLSGNSGTVTIQCKPLFRKAHVCVSSSKASVENALADATEKWNSEVIDIDNWKPFRQ